MGSEMCIRDRTEGVQSVDPKGWKVRVFLDIVSMMGDLPQAASYSDVRGNSATTFCPLCSMRRRKNTPEPERNFSSEIHSGRMGYIRFDERRRAIRANYTDPAVHRSLGLRKPNAATVWELPAVKLSNRSRHSRDITDDDGGKFVLPCIFDHSRSIPALPDHVLSGLISNLMHACFACLNNDEQRKRVEKLIV